jgi:hypothetical protein
VYGILDKSDVVVVDMHITVLDEDREEPCDRVHHIRVVLEDGDPDMGVYDLLWASEPIANGVTSPDVDISQLYRIVWRGNWETTIREWGDIVQDLLAQKAAGDNALARIKWEGNIVTGGTPAVTINQV